MHSLLFATHKLLLALTSNPLHACSVIAIPPHGHVDKRHPLVQESASPLLVWTQNPLAFPALVL